MSQIALTQLIQTHNPFSEFTVRTQDIWGQGFPDEPSLNAHASDAVFQAIEQLQSHQRKVAGITIRAEKGLGKSHIISRIRHRIQEMGNAIFIYMGDYGNLNDIRSEFLKTLAISLKYTGSKNVTQWQELATDILNDVYKKSYKPQKLISALPNQLEKNPNFVGELTDKVCLKKPEISDPSLIQAILWTLSPVHAPHAISWLSGKNLPQNKSDQLSLPNSGQADRSSESFDIACEILGLISQYKSIVICFDQLEGTEISDSGFTKAQVAASFGMDLYNNITRGVLLTAVYPDIWFHQIRALPSAEAVIDRVGEHIVDLKFLNADDVVSLVKRRLTSFYANHRIAIPHELYPFDEEVLREKGKQKATARDILQWCCKNWKASDGTAPIIPSSENFVEAAYKKELNALDGNDFMDDKVKLSKAISFAFENLVGKTLEGVQIAKIDCKISPKSANKDYIDFRILGVEDSHPVKIGVSIIQHPTGIGVHAGLSRLTDYKKFDLTRGCLLRSKEISPTAKKARQLVDDLLGKLGGEWPPMQVDDLLPLLAIRSVFDAREDYDLTESEIRKFIDKKGLAEKNSLLLEILSKPSGQVPDNLADDSKDSPLVNPIQDSISGDIDDLDFSNVA
jgi:hypothetical protein